MRVGSERGCRSLCGGARDAIHLGRVVIFLGDDSLHVIDAGRDFP